MKGFIKNIIQYKDHFKFTIISYIIGVLISIFLLLYIRIEYYFKNITSSNLKNYYIVLFILLLLAFCISIVIFKVYRDKLGIIFTILIFINIINVVVIIPITFIVICNNILLLREMINDKKLLFILILTLLIPLIYCVFSAIDLVIYIKSRKNGI